MKKETIANIGSDEIWGFYTRGRTGLSLGEVIVQKGRLRIHFSRDLWGAFINTDRTVLRLIFKKNGYYKGPIYSEELPLDEKTRITIRATSLPQPFLIKHPQLTAR